MLDNEIGAEEAKGLCEMLKVNTTLTRLGLEGEKERKGYKVERRKNNRQCGWSGRCKITV